jgi:hypothetical protein
VRWCRVVAPSWPALPTGTMLRVRRRRTEHQPWGMHRVYVLHAGVARRWPCQIHDGACLDSREMALACAEERA